MEKKKKTFMSALLLISLSWLVAQFSIRVIIEFKFEILRFAKETLF